MVHFLYLVVFMPTYLLGSDHAGFLLKERLRKLLLARRIRFEDLSPDMQDGDDYPDVAQRMAKHVAKHPEAHGILVCGSGFGMEIAANRFRGVRAVVARTAEEAHLAREHNHANILVFGERFTSPAQAEHILTAWMEASPSLAQRHVRRIHKLDAL